jgi:aconitate hydratase
MLQLTDRDATQIELIKKYLQAVRMYRRYDDSREDPVFSEVLELDLATIVPSVSGPKRPQDRVAVSEMKEDFENCLRNKVRSYSTPHHEFSIISKPINFDQTEQIQFHNSHNRTE